MSVEQNNFRLFADLEGRKEEDLIAEIKEKVRLSPNFYINGNFEWKHILSADQFSREDLIQVINTTYLVKDLKKQRDPKLRNVCEEIIQAQLLYEASSRTDLSNQASISTLGGHVIVPANGINFSSGYKGENFPDTIRAVGCYADLIVCRHPKPGVTYVGAYYLDMLAEQLEEQGAVLISAGDGIGEHPTQGLLDMFTLVSELGDLGTKHIVLVGDLKNGRTVHSDLLFLSKLAPGCHVTLVSPDELRMPEHLVAEARSAGIIIDETDELNTVIDKADGIYWTRIQEERFINKEDYEKVKNRFIFTPDMLNKMKDTCILLHPLPRKDEMGSQQDHDKIDNDKRNKIFRQMKNGKYVRMALAVLVTGNESRL